MGWLFAQLEFMNSAKPIMRKEDEGNNHCFRNGFKCLREYMKKTNDSLGDRTAP